MLRYPVVLFDLDGTLIDSVDLIVDSYHHVDRVHGLRPRSREEILAGIGTPLRSVFGKLTDDPVTIEQWIVTYREYNLAHHDTRIQPYAGAVDAVRRLRHAGARLGLVTSKFRSGAQRGLTLVGLGDAMEVIVGADDVTHPKPHPEPVERALAALNAAPGDAVFIGDSLHDIHSGRAAGVSTIGVTWGPFDRDHLAQAEPDFIIDAPDELVAIVQAGAAS